MQVFTVLILPHESTASGTPSRTSIWYDSSDEPIVFGTRYADAISRFLLPPGEGIPHNLLPTVKICTEQYCPVNGVGNEPASILTAIHSPSDSGLSVRETALSKISLTDSPARRYRE